MAANFFLHKCKFTPHPLDTENFALIAAVIDVDYILSDNNTHFLYVGVGQGIQKSVLSISLSFII